MTGTREALIEQASSACAKLDIPCIRTIFMPEPTPSPDRDSEFGMVVLEDNAAGLYYAWMGESQSGMNQRFDTQQFIGCPPLELVEYYRHEHEADRSLGLAAVNAISQSVFRQLHCQLPGAGDSIGELDTRPGDHIGMVGYFPSLVRRLRQKDLRVTVIERKTHLLQQDELVTVSGDIRLLEHCNKVLSTASTLLNDSLDEVLHHARDAEMITVVGPTAGFLPGVLFERGVSAVGGSEIVDVELALARLSRKEGLGDAARKYLLRPADYAATAAGLMEK